MIEKMEGTSGNSIAFKVNGTIDTADYAVMVPEVERLIGEVGDINILLDLTRFHWEKVSAWGADFAFGAKYHKRIRRMAIVGDKKWQKWLTALVDPFYAREAKFFHSKDLEAAWAWLNEPD